MTIEVTPPRLFGKHHWSLFAYLSDRCTKGLQGVGLISRSSMRCNEVTHPHRAPWPCPIPWRPEQSTKIVDEVLEGHDDWDCLADLQCAGLIEVVNPQTLSVRMTPVGIQLHSRLRAHQSRGGHFGNFAFQE